MHIEAASPWHYVFRRIIGIAGVPGSGKTSLAMAVCQRINQQTGMETAIQVPMEGFHYYKKEQDAMPNPKLAYARRGAHWTFNAHAYVKFLQTIKAQGL